MRVYPKGIAVSVGPLHELRDNFTKCNNENIRGFIVANFFLFFGVKAIIIKHHLRDIGK